MEKITFKTEVVASFYDTFRVLPCVSVAKFLSGVYFFRVVPFVSVAEWV